MEGVSPLVDRAWSISLPKLANDAQVSGGYKIATIWIVPITYELRTLDSCLNESAHGSPKPLPKAGQMRDAFRAYYTPTKEEFDQIWTDGAIVLDTNTLLNLFRYTETTRNQFLEVLKKLQDSLWLPHQVGLEFHNRRLDVINHTSDAFSKIRNASSSAKNDISKTLDSFKHHPSIDREDIGEHLEKLFETFNGNIDRVEKKHKSSVVASGKTEETFDRITQLFDGKVGSAHSKDELDELEIDGKRRYDEKIPPGYKDQGKTNGNEFGDLIIWKQMLNYGSENESPMMFVTDDAKEDWWRKVSGKTLGPRTELIDEYWSASGRRIHFYEPLQFLEHAKQKTRTDVSSDSLREVENVSNSDERLKGILDSKRQELERRISHSHRIIDRQRAETSNSTSRSELFSELRRITEEEENLQHHAGLYIDDPQPLFLEGTEPAERERSLLKASDEARLRSTYYRRQAQDLAARKRYLEKKLREDPEAEERMSMREKAMRKLESELEDVNAAIADLDR